MNTASEQRDRTETDRALSRLVGLVVVIAAGVLAVAAWLSLEQKLTGERALHMGLLSVLVTVASLTSVRFRMRSTMLGTSWGEVAMLVVVVVLPLPFATMVVFVGVLVAKLLRRRQPMKVAFGTAKETITSFAAGLTLVALDMPRIEKPIRISPVCCRLRGDHGGRRAHLDPTRVDGHADKPP